ncbi:MAG: LuxR C-terminal-related transcriptional regulator [Acidobacteria bacterium]|nr:LuxR C-terminal-related transcriptional regulator [Acidobacteriota bacterium]
MATKLGSATMDDLLKQAKTTNRLLAAQLKSQMSQMDLVKLLSTTGLSAREIADVLDTTAPTVAVTLQRLRQKMKKTSLAKSETEE